MASTVVTSMKKVTVFVTMVVDAAENEVVREEAEAVEGLAAMVGEEALAGGAPGGGGGLGGGGPGSGGRG
jgi:hypothetical protein